MQFIFAMQFYDVTFVLAAILLHSLRCCTAVTEDDIKECGTSIFSRVNCSSVNFYYSECPVPGADEVTKIKLSQNLTREVCEFEISFGFRMNAVWVTDGCSGEFYVCYDGVGTTTTKEPVVSTVEITRESTEDTTDNATLYIIIAVTLVVLALVGLIAGCLLKRRQSNEKLRKLAEKRQMSLEARDNKIDDDVRITPIIRQSSVESMNFPEGSVDLDKYEKVSNSSSRSSTSGVASVSSRATGRHITSNRPGSGRLSLVLDPREIKRGRSVPDIRAGYSGKGMQSNQSYRGSQTSLDSILEVAFSEKSTGQNSDRNRRYIQNPFKYNTVGFRGNRIDNTYNPKRSGLTLPTKRTQTKAIVHARRSSQDSVITNLNKTESDTNVRFQSHYEEPQGILGAPNLSSANAPVNKTEVNEQCFRPVDPAKSLTENIYSTVKKPKKPRPVIAPKPGKVIYSEVNIGTLPALQRSDSPGSDISLEENNNQHLTIYKTADSKNENDDHQKTQHYALMHTFKPNRDYEDVELSAETEPYQILSSVKPAKF